MENLRNFVIIAHIDHGKSTLADRFLELTRTIEKRKMREQYLDQMELEREKGITIKMQPVQMIYQKESQAQDQNIKIQVPNKFQDNLEFKNSKQAFVLNLIDTPGHVDFSYEVSRSLKAVEGAILLVDATQGIQAQTVAHYHLAKKQNLVIIPAINKIDLPSARIKETEEELISLCQVKREEIFKISAKTGEGVKELLEAVIEKIPPPPIQLEKPFRALIFDSFYDPHRGVIAYLRVFEGEIREGEEVCLYATQAKFKVKEVGIFKPELVKKEKLVSGEIGYLVTGLREPAKVRVGDTLYKSQEKIEPLEGYREPKPLVFASVYPQSSDDYELLKKALEKLKLNDASLFYQPTSSSSFGRGFLMGFLGLLHLEIIRERLKREFHLETIFTPPTVSFKLLTFSGQEKEIFRASDWQTQEKIKAILEPWVLLEIYSPFRYFNEIMKLKTPFRLIYKETQYLGEVVMMKFEAPLGEIITNFYDQLKSVSEGYASLNYEFLEYRPGDLVKLEIFLAGEKFEGFSRILHREKVEKEARVLVEKLKEILPRENFPVAIQAVVENRVIARETLPALKKNVTAHLYGGDRTRKMKLWQKQKEGKKRLKERGRVKVPSRVYLEILKFG